MTQLSCELAPAQRVVTAGKKASTDASRAALVTSALGLAIDSRRLWRPVASAVTVLMGEMGSAKVGSGENGTVAGRM
jgi:hypothetical protein